MDIVLFLSCGFSRADGGGDPNYSDDEYTKEEEKKSH
jgi:hypothetical protein